MTLPPPPEGAAATYLSLIWDRSPGTSRRCSWGHSPMIPANQALPKLMHPSHWPAFAGLPKATGVVTPKGPGACSRLTGHLFLPQGDPTGSSLTQILCLNVPCLEQGALISSSPSLFLHAFQEGLCFLIISEIDSGWSLGFTGHEDIELESLLPGQGPSSLNH